MAYTKKIATVSIALVILFSGGVCSDEIAQDEGIPVLETPEKVEIMMDNMPEGITEENKTADETAPDIASIVKEIIARGYNGAVLEDRNQVLRFQAENNLMVDGIVGNMTMKALTEKNKRVYDIVPEEFIEKEWVIVINKTKKILTVYKNGEIYKKYPVALGKHSSPTPDHKFTIINKIVDPYWGGMGGKYTPVRGGAPNNPLGRRWLGLSTDRYKGYGIHGNSDPFSIGKFISAGCIRMINEDVEELFEYIPIGTEVWIGTEDVLEKWGVKQYIEYIYQAALILRCKYIGRLLCNLPCI